jgi:Arc/MetJ family transcription regulator
MMVFASIYPASGLVFKSLPILFFRKYNVYKINKVYTMRTNIVIDDKLMTDVLRLTGLKTKKEAVEEGLRALIRLAQQAEIRKLRGQIQWVGNLEEMRTNN